MDTLKAHSDGLYLWYLTKWREYPLSRLVLLHIINSLSRLSLLLWRVGPLMKGRRATLSIYTGLFHFFLKYGLVLQGLVVITVTWKLDVVVREFLIFTKHQECNEDHYAWPNYYASTTDIKFVAANYWFQCGKGGKFNVLWKPQCRLTWNFLLLGSWKTASTVWVLLISATAFTRLKIKVRTKIIFILNLIPRSII